MRWTVVGPVAAVVVAALAALTIAAVDDDEPRSAVATTTTAEPAPIEVASDAPRRASLAELASASDVVVRATVVATERGRSFGDPGGAASIESRFVTLDVTEVLRGSMPAGTTLLVEEEGWSADGAPLIVDGLQPSAVDDDGIWFLVDVGDDDLPTFVVASAQGRYLVHGDALTGAAGDDPLVAELSALGASGLAAAVRALP